MSMSMNTSALRFFKTAIVLLVVGLAVGIGMAASHDHTIAGAHAHLNLLGFVVSAVYGTFFALAPAKAEGRLPVVIWALHSVGTVTMFGGLALLLRGNTDLEPVVALSSLLVFAAALLFAYAVWKPVRAEVGLRTSGLSAAE